MSDNPQSLAGRLSTLRRQITEAERRYARMPGSVHLLAVSKKHPPTAIVEAHAAGQRAFGENFVQEALDKKDTPIILALEPAPEWHFIGHIQSNKCTHIAEHFSWVHSLTRPEIATRLARHRTAEQPPLNVCIEVNVDAEANKDGVAFSEITALAQHIAKCPELRFRGLMAIPKVRKEFDVQRATFAKVRQAFEQLQAEGFAIDTLSMGMSADFEAAIAEGATWVRVGTAMFGPRPTKSR